LCRRASKASRCWSCHASHSCAKPIVITVTEPIAMAPPDPASVYASLARTFCGPSLSNSSNQSLAFGAVLPPAHREVS
jgi:hypothetical protein